MEQLICELVKEDGKTHLLCCFQSGAVSMALCASLSLCPATLWAFQSPLSGPLFLPKPSYSLLFLCLVFCLRPSLIRCAGSNFPIYKHLKYLHPWLFLPCSHNICNIKYNIKQSWLSWQIYGPCLSASITYHHPLSTLWTFPTLCLPAALFIGLFNALWEVCVEVELRWPPLSGSLVLWEV